MATTQYTRSLKWNHIGRRSNNGGLFPWAKREFRKRTNHHMRTKCAEVEEWEKDLLWEQQWKRDWLATQTNLNNWLRFEAAINDYS